jgi:cation diffusion facilitator CzcD-associated flavoprotein CzcO
MDAKATQVAAGAVLDRAEAVCVIGAGPAGLAAARALKVRGIGYDQVERHTGVGGIWDIDAPGSPMYEAAHFISSKTMSAFVGHPIADELPDYPSHRQILAYLKSFAERYDLESSIHFDHNVTRLEKETNGTWVVHRSDGQKTRYRAVVCCTGSQWIPRLPDLPGDFAGDVMHSKDYRDMGQVAGRRVLVVGGGNSACDIAVDAGRVARSAVISMRRGYWFIPKHIFGVPADVFAEKGPRLPQWLQQRLFAGMLRLLQGRPERLGLQKPDHLPLQTHPVLNSNLYLALQHGDIRARPGIADTNGSTITFTDGWAEEFDLVIMATGYRHAVPYAQEYFGSEQHPELYLTAFSRHHAGLFGLGFTETNSGAYTHFDSLSQMIASYLEDQALNPDRAARFEHMIKTDRPELSGGIHFDPSPRHQGYVDAHALTHYRDEIFKQMGWRMISDMPANSDVRIGPGHRTVEAVAS